MRPSSGFCTRRSVRVMDTVTLQCWTAQIRNSGVAPAAERLRETAENSGLRRNGDKDFEMQSGKRAPENARRHEGQWAHDLTSPHRPREGRRPKPLTQSAAWPLSGDTKEKARTACTIRHDHCAHVPGARQHSVQRWPLPRTKPQPLMSHLRAAKNQKSAIKLPLCQMSFAWARAATGKQPWEELRHRSCPG